MAKKIIFFDSGAGGLTVLHEALTILPNEHYLYFGDTAFSPYGTKSKKRIKKRVHSIIKKITKKYEIKALVVACNTATSVAIKSLRKKYEFPIIGMEPAVKLAVDKSSGKKILVCATDLTLKEEKLDRLITQLKAKEKADLLSLQELVTFAEQFNFSSQELSLYLENKFSDINWDHYDSIVLGCTHFIFFKDELQKHFSKYVSIYDGNEGTLKNLARKIKPSQRKKGKIKFMISSRGSGEKYSLPFLEFLNQNQEKNKS